MLTMTVLRAVVIGILVALAGTLPWATLVALNQKFLPSVPWSVLPTIPYLWFFWRYAKGEGWPRSTSQTRRLNCRANRLSEEAWGAAIIAGVLGLVCLVLFMRVMNRMVALPQQHEDLSRFSAFSILFLVLMGSIVAGVVEETAFRGYMQRPIERRHGPVIAILVTGVLFGFAHFSHREVTLALLPFFLAVAAIYGTMAYLTDSILPGMVVHAGGDVMGAMDFLVRGQSEWQASPTPTSALSPTIQTTGTAPTKR